MKTTYMLDAFICSFIMREQPISFLQTLQSKVAQQHRVVISAITYAEIQYGAIGRKASPKHQELVNGFMHRLDAVLPWDMAAVDASAKVKKQLSDQGTPIGANDTAIAGHAMAIGCVLVTNNIREFSRVEGLTYEDWSN